MLASSPVIASVIVPQLSPTACGVIQCTSRARLEKLWKDEGLGSSARAGWGWGKRGVSDILKRAERYGGKRETPCFARAGPVRPHRPKPL